MAFSINQVTLVGNVAREPELKYTPNGTPICTFSVATNRNVKKGEKYEEVPTFHRIVVWNKMAEFVSRSVVKGQKIYVDGRIDNRSYEKKDGTKGHTSEVVAFNVIPFSQSRTSPSKLATSPSEANPTTTSSNTIDEATRNSEGEVFPWENEPRKTEESVNPDEIQS